MGLLLSLYWNITEYENNLKGEYCLINGINKGNSEDINNESENNADSLSIESIKKEYCWDKAKTFGEIADDLLTKHLVRYPFFLLS